MSFFPCTSTCPQCGRPYTWFGGVIIYTLYADPGYCSIECARARLLYLILLFGSGTRAQDAPTSKEK